MDNERVGYRGIRAASVIATLLVALLTGGWLMERGAQSRPAVVDGSRLFDGVLSHVARFYIDSVEAGDLYHKAMEGMLQGLGDPHTVYLPPSRLARLTENTTGNYGGLGIEMDVRDGWITIVTPLPSSPAERAGIQTADRIVEIDGTSTRGMTADEARRQLRGSPGSAVRITIARPGVAEPMSFNITRSQIHRPALRRSAMLSPGVGYVELGVFSESTVVELRSAVAKLRAQGARTLLLDLRSNPGGLLEQGVAVSDMFLDQGKQIVEMRGRGSDGSSKYVASSPQEWADMSLMVLINEGSASASEIVAGALQDHDRAVLVGATTFGKGSAQSVIGMPDGGALKLTTAIWYTPAGRSINKGLDTRPAAAQDELMAPLPEVETRPRYTTASGRVVYGGGGITPDIVVQNEQLQGADIAFQRALGRHVPAFRDALTDYGIALRGSGTLTARDFGVTPAMISELWNRMERRGIRIDRAIYDAAEPLVSRLLAYEIARYVFGPDAEFLRMAEDDPVIQAALELAEGTPAQAELFNRVSRHGMTGAQANPQR
jgi:carboxyl-terminal processing protease